MFFVCFYLCGLPTIETVIPMQSFKKKNQTPKWEIFYKILDKYSWTVKALNNMEDMSKCPRPVEVKEILQLSVIWNTGWNLGILKH